MNYLTSDTLYTFHNVLWSMNYWILKFKCLLWDTLYFQIFNDVKLLPTSEVFVWSEVYFKGIIPRSVYAAVWRRGRPTATAAALLERMVPSEVFTPPSLAGVFFQSFLFRSSVLEPYLDGEEFMILI